ncbi:sugar phosphate nucleotidyltransferase [Halorientalis marina]|uniref:sugar phosphate nucleotidyltransferase n=1 Tax=Halorientalis marina TaxID=2931976 RepID=UPI001FF6BB9B|nr:sugar phosphate nucleotidyltransferase [Halorientalis marina]
MRIRVDPDTTEGEAQAIAEALAEHFADDVELYATTGDEPLASAAAPAGANGGPAAADGPAGDGDFLAMNGDNVFDADLAAVPERHHATGADVTLLAEDVPREEAVRAGVIELDDAGRVTGLVEKPDDPPSATVPRGFYAFSPAVFEACRPVDSASTGEYELTPAIDDLLAAGGTVETVPLDGWATNVDTPADRDAVAARLE